MYEFTDINKGTGEDNLDLSSVAITYDGVLIDSEVPYYRTLNVSGRELLGRKLKLYGIPGRDGGLITENQIPTRKINVEYLISCDNAIDFRESFNNLNALLHRKREVVVSFADEEFYFKGILSKVKKNKIDSNTIIGEYEILCSDPYKYSELKVIPDTSYIVIPSGLLYPILINEIEIIIDSDCEQINIHNQDTGNKIVINHNFKNNDEVKIAYEKGKVYLNNQNITGSVDYILSNWEDFELNSDETLESNHCSNITLKYNERLL